MGLVKGEDEEEEEEEEQGDDDTPAGWPKKVDPDGKTFYQEIEYKINKRPRFADDDELFYGALEHRDVKKLAYRKDQTTNNARDTKP